MPIIEVRLRCERCNHPRVMARESFVQHIFNGVGLGKVLKWVCSVCQTENIDNLS